MIDTIWLQAIPYGVAGLLCVAAYRTPVDPPPADAFAGARAALLDELRHMGIHDARVLDAVAAVPRHEFVPLIERPAAYLNRALPIAGGQTISQPYIVALMTELLELQPQDRILEVGTGSGYQAAVLSRLAHEVYSIEIDPALADTARALLQRLHYTNVQVRAGDGFFGWPEAAPFAAIIVTAAAPRIPQRLVDQLAPGGRLVMPLSDGSGDGETLIRARKQGDRLTIERVAPVAFVPMRGAVRTPTR